METRSLKNSPVRIPVCGRRGSALVISLVFIILITIVLVGFVTTAGLERKTVQSHYGKVQADLFNSMAVGVVASRITQATSGTDSAGKPTWWVSQPGRIACTPFGTTATVPVTTFVDLSSGQADSPAVEDVAVDLNPASLTQGIGIITSAPSTRLPVKWIYVRKDGTQEVAGTSAPAYYPANPCVGRYAYWTDDEAARINVNTAASRTAPQNEVATHPARIDLTTFPPLVTADVQALREARNTRLFNSLEDLKSVDDSTNIASAVSENKEALTHYNQSPELNRFGEPRIVLTTQKSLAGGLPFIDILNADNVDPGVDGNLDKAKIEALFTKLYAYFNKRACDWGIPGPVTFNKTLALKYGPVGAAQIIVNLIDYVRSAESTEPLILPLRGAFQAPTFTYGIASAAGNGNYGPNAMRGNSRRLRIVEMGVWIPAAPVTNIKLKAKIFRDSGSGTRVSLSGLPFQYSISSPALTLNSPNYTITASDIAEPDPTIGPGEYRTVTVNIPVAVASRPATIAMRLAIKNNAGISYDIAPIEDSGDKSKYAQYTVDAAGTTEAGMTSICTDDPVINQCFADWKQGNNSFGNQNRPSASKLGQPAAAMVPQQDTDADGLLTNVSLLLPSVKGSSENPLGLVGSSGEIGKVHSGGRGTSSAGTPWRSLRLQPRSGNGVVPDWLILDLFTIPLQAKNAADQAVLRPSTNTLGGRVNLNEMLFPFSTAQMTRDAPLRSIVRSLKPGITDADANVLVENILSQTLASGSNPGTAFGPATFTNEKLYPMTGEISEIKGLADSGESSEDFVRGMVGFLTTQSNVFSVFSVGQKIQQLPSGTIKILGESRTRTVLERNEDLSVPWKAGGTWKMRVLSTTELGL